MPNHDFIVDNNPGVTFRADINAALAALAQLSSGTVEPTVKYPGMLWLDTSISPDGQLRMRNQANTGWIVPAGLISRAQRVIILTSQTYTKPAGLKYLEAIAIGAGGGTMPSVATAAAQGSAVSGAGGGGVARKLFDASAIGATVTVTIGAGGANTGTAGGNTTFGSLLTANGGSPGNDTAAGAGNISGSVINGGAGGSASLGDTNNSGQRGGTGWRMWGGGVYSSGGDGGGNVMCTGVRGLAAQTTQAGVAGLVPGGGASGGCNGASQAATVGATGGGGAVYLMEYY
jgi:hypothetical protein